MNVLDENLPDSQRRLLRTRRIPFREIGVDVGASGAQDDEVLRMLHR